MAAVKVPEVLKTFFKNGQSHCDCGSTIFYYMNDVVIVFDGMKPVGAHDTGEVIVCQGCGRTMYFNVSKMYYPER